MAFVKATKKKAKARVAIVGPAGSGKTWTALELALALGNKVAVRDSEHGSASKYSDLFAFDTDEPTDHSTESYIRSIKEAEDGGYDVLILDSLSHGWAGSGGILEQADKGGGRFDAWKDLTPKQNKLIEAILASKIHIIATLRSKTEYVIEKVKNRSGNEVSAPRKVGLAPVQRDGMEYEFDLVLFADDANNLSVAKTRCAALSGQSWHHETKKIADVYKAWLSDGEDAEAKKAKVVELAKALKDNGIGDDARLGWMSKQLKRAINGSSDMTIADLDVLLLVASAERDAQAAAKADIQNQKDTAA